MPKPIYVLGTGLSHDGSACLLKDGKILVAIEKERVTRIKHHGGNDTVAINYCLGAAGIQLSDLTLVVQNANFSNLQWGNDYYNGKRLFSKDIDVPVTTISHHLAHAFSVIGTCPHDDFSVLVIDGCGSSLDDCTDLDGATVTGIDAATDSVKHMFCEKDSYYQFKDGKTFTLYKDFSEYGFALKGYPMHPPTTKHSIGGIYDAVSSYVFGGLHDAGKLMGLAPYGKPNVYHDEIFILENGSVKVNYEWMKKFRFKEKSIQEFKTNFKHYADIAYWVQKEIERALLYVVSHRMSLNNCTNLGYSGGVALNAVANTRLLLETNIKDMYVEPASGDNGLAIGCAFYGWLETLKKERVKHSGSTFFGSIYPADKVRTVLETYTRFSTPVQIKKSLDVFFRILASPQFNSRFKAGNSVTQFILGEYGVYQLVSADSRVNVYPEITFTPTLKISLEGPALLQAVLSGNYTLANNQNSGIVGLEDFLHGIDKQNLSAELRDRLARNQLLEEFSYTYTDDFISKTASLLAQGKVIGWFQDECEFGPRALGKRSILADPCKKGVRDFINLKVKFREEFRPFAPSVLLEDQHKYFEYDFESPYMLMVNRLRPEWRDKMQSIMHEDFSSRVQTVTENLNSKYYGLLSAFKNISGYPVLLNTSFNKRGMPIVETPHQALDFFFESGMDYLVIDKYIVSKKENTAAVSDKKMTTAISR